MSVDSSTTCTNNPNKIIRYGSGTLLLCRSRDARPASSTFDTKKSLPSSICDKQRAPYYALVLATDTRWKRKAYLTNNGKIAFNQPSPLVLFLVTNYYPINFPVHISDGNTYPITGIPEILLSEILCLAAEPRRPVAPIVILLQRDK